jgi:ligand-binding SRPBCC domain-containing protein
LLNIKNQFVPASIEEVWEFISSPSNLKKITPDYMGFDITSEKPLKISFHGKQDILTTEVLRALRNTKREKIAVS